MTLDKAIREATTDFTTHRRITVEKRSILTGEMNSMRLLVDLEDFSRWKNGTLIQDAMPYLTAVEREFLISGMSEFEQETYFDPCDTPMTVKETPNE